MLNDRGVPTNSKVRTAIAPSLSPTGQAEVAYIDKIGSMTLQPTFIGSPGSTQVTDITNRAKERRAARQGQPRTKPPTGGSARLQSAIS